jgi:hypothetical protein
MRYFGLFFVFRYYLFVWARVCKDYRFAFLSDDFTDLEITCSDPICFFPFVVSGEAATEPVVSKFGHVYERRLIVKHLNESGGKCPVTGAPLAEEDLIAIQGEK